MEPLIGLTLAHPEQAPLHHLEAVRLQVGQNEEQPVFGGRQGAVLLHAKLAGSPRFPIEAPGRHMGLEGLCSAKILSARLWTSSRQAATIGEGTTHA